MKTNTLTSKLKPYPFGSSQRKMILQITLFFFFLFFLIKVGESTLVSFVPLEKFHCLVSLSSPDAIFSCFAEVTQIDDGHSQFPSGKQFAD